MTSRGEIRGIYRQALSSENRALMALYPDAESKLYIQYCAQCSFWLTASRRKAQDMWRYLKLQCFSVIQAMSLTRAAANEQ